MKKCINFFIAFLCCLFFSCDMEIEEILRQKRLEYISVDTTEAVKLEYLIGDKFNSEGIKIYGHYSDETQVEEDLRLVSFSGFDSSQAAEKNTITVLFNEKETTFDVKIHESKIEKIQIIQKPIKQFFRVGESNDTTGIIVKATYTNGNETPLAEDEYILEGFDSSKAGMCLVNVILKEDTKIYDAYTVVFQDYDIKEIKISKNPNKLIYMVGEELDLTGLEVYATPENGLPPFLLPQYNYSPASIKDITATGKQTITINVNEVKASFDIEIVDAYVKGFVVKDKDGNPEGGIIEDSKRIYCAGDTFKLEHFEFYELYSNDAIGQEITRDNGKMEKLSFVFGGEEHGYEDECEFGGEPGVYTIPIKYEFEDITTKENTSSTIEIKVCVTDSEIYRIEANWSFNGGFGYPKWITPDNSNPDYGKWTVNAILKTEDKIDITNMCSFEYKERTEKNKNKVDVIVKYHDIRTKTDFETIGEVVVIDPILQKVEIVNLPKTEYVEGEDVDLSELSVKCFYSNDSSIVVEDFETYDIRPKTIVDTSPITITFPNNVQCTIPIKIINNDVIGISVEAKTYDFPNPFSFREGKLYGSNFFEKYFSVYRVKKFGGKESNQIESSHLNYTIKNGSIIIVYNPTGGTYSTIYKDDKIEIKILPALPTSVEILPNEAEDYNGLEGIINSLNTKLIVKYANLKEDVIEKNIDNKFTDGVGTYELKQTNYGINVEFTPNEYAVKEKEEFEIITFQNVLSKNKIIVEDQDIKINYKDIAKEADISKLNVFMEYSNGKIQKIKKVEINQNLRFKILWGEYNYKMPDMTGKILVTYTDPTDTSYYCTYYNVKYLPPKPITIDVVWEKQTDTEVSQETPNDTEVSQEKQTDTGDSEGESTGTGVSQEPPIGTEESEETPTKGSRENPISIGALEEILELLSWTVTYEDGSVLSKEDSELPENNEDKRLKPEFTIDENNTILLKGNCWQPKFSEKIEDKGDYIYKITVKDETLYFKLNNDSPEVPEEAVGGENP